MKFDIMRKFFKDMLTESSAEYDITRISMFLFVLSYIGISIYMVIAEKHIDLIDWSIGASTVLGAGGASVGVRARLEDKVNNRIDSKFDKKDDSQE